jgi:hypothetical protein
MNLEKRGKTTSSSSSSPTSSNMINLPAYAWNLPESLPAALRADVSTAAIES